MRDRDGRKVRIQNKMRERKQQGAREQSLTVVSF